ncbi:hypothetical protein ACIRRA_33735 [Nocardia sp. NPDC101769]|uniref:hypothetical protein n=1 Tax=Nocardia sp. NPDC101769 TaxID=3364333 RepID=UPI00381F549F
MDGVHKRALFWLGSIQSSSIRFEMPQVASDFRVAQIYGPGPWGCVVEPISLGVAAAALLASKFGEGFAKNAGESAWSTVKRIRELIASRAEHDPGLGEAAATVVTVPTKENQSMLAAAISKAAEADPAFAAELHRALSAARRDHAVDVFIAQAFDSSRQLNIYGGNSGPISI